MCDQFIAQPVVSEDKGQIVHEGLPTLFVSAATEATQAGSNVIHHPVRLQPKQMEKKKFKKKKEQKIAIFKNIKCIWVQLFAVNCHL